MKPIAFFATQLQRLVLPVRFPVMCGRYALYIYLPQVAELFRIRGKVPDFVPRYNIAPSQQVPVVRETVAGGPREIAMMRWGFVPSWSQDPVRIGSGGPPPPINARSETVETKPAFREAFKHRRCIIPASGFYEWKAAAMAGHSRGGKQPYFITVGDAPFAMAGLWEHWSPTVGAEQEPFDSCVVLTTPPNTLMASLHDRMPLILPREDWDHWLAPGTSREEVRAMLRPLGGAEMALRPVGRRVNSPRFDDPGCLEPPDAETAQDEPPSLFGSA